MITCCKRKNKSELVNEDSGDEEIFTKEENIKRPKAGFHNDDCSMSFSANRAYNTEFRSIPNRLFSFQDLPIKHFGNLFKSLRQPLKLPLADEKKQNYTNSRINPSIIEPSGGSSRFEVTIRNLEPPLYRPRSSYNPSYNSTVHD